MGSALKKSAVARDSHERDYDAQINKLNNEEEQLTARLNELNKKKLETAKANGDVDAADGDLIEINAGGKVIAAKRGTLTQLKGTRLESLFSGRWDKKLQRDSNGRIFLDVNPLCFQALVDYLNERTISSEHNPPELPSIDDEYQNILRHQLELFGLVDEILLPSVELPNSAIVKEYDHHERIHEWLREDGSDGDFQLLYRSSRDGLSASNFHSNCDSKGCTLTVIETTDGLVVGGYSNTPWENSSVWKQANKAFLFALSGNGISSPSKMKLKNANDKHATFHHPSHGPVFGGSHDLDVNGSNLRLHQGSTYEVIGPFVQQSGYQQHAIKEMEVFRVSGTTITPKPMSKKEKKRQKSILDANTPATIEKVNSFSKDVNNAINEMWASLKQFESEILFLEESFKDEGTFVLLFACGNPQDVIALNVSGTTMVTSQRSLQLCAESSLASRFSISEQDEEACDSKTIKEWDTEDVVAWLNRTDGISETVVISFEENEVSGRELLALGREGLMELGVTKIGTVYLLLDEIRKLETSSHDSVTLIEHSPYCFGKILDYLRLEGSFVKNLVPTKPELPVVCESEKARFQKVVKHFFPGNSSKFILG